MADARERISFGHTLADGSNWMIRVSREAIEDGLSADGHVGPVDTARLQETWVDQNSVRLAEIATRKINKGLVDGAIVTISKDDL